MNMLVWLPLTIALLTSLGFGISKTKEIRAIKDWMSKKQIPHRKHILEALESWEQSCQQPNTPTSAALDFSDLSESNLSQALRILNDHAGYEPLKALLSTCESVLNSTLEAWQSLEKGQLTLPYPEQDNPLLIEIQPSAQRAMKRLMDTISAIGHSAHIISSNARELARGNEDLSNRTEAQASSLAQSAANMEELSATTKENANQAAHANELAQETREFAFEGGSVVEKVGKAMKEIHQSSEQISAIISVIDDIAFQTNLLALNASVEAARAGEQGRGFAVVAAEVRNLAQRSADAAKEIKGLIQNSAQKVHAGSRLVEESSQSLSKIVDHVKQVSEMVAHISLATQEQSQGISSVNESLNNLDEITQKNTALVEEAAAAAASMDTQAQEMNKLFDYFSLQRDHADKNPAPMKSEPAAAKEEILTLNASDEEWAEF